MRGQGQRFIARLRSRAFQRNIVEQDSAPQQTAGIITHRKAEHAQPAHGGIGQRQVGKTLLLRVMPDAIKLGLGAIGIDGQGDELFAHVEASLLPERAAIDAKQALRAWI